MIREARELFVFALIVAGAIGFAYSLPAILIAFGG